VRERSASSVCRSQAPVRRIRVNVTRTADNLYKASASGAYIETQLCSEQAYNEPGTLDFPGPATQGTLYFSQSGQQCSVVRVLQDGAAAPLTHDQQIVAVAQSMGWYPPPGVSDPEQILWGARNYVQYPAKHVRQPGCCTNRRWTAAMGPGVVGEFPNRQPGCLPHTLSVML
jgi:hypothetical protein